MRFNEVYDFLLMGKAIRRNRWKPNSCLRMKNGVIYMCTDLEHKPVSALKVSVITATDWQTTDMPPCKTLDDKKDLLRYLEDLNNSI